MGRCGGYSWHSFFLADPFYVKFLFSSLGGEIIYGPDLLRAYIPSFDAVYTTSLVVSFANKIKNL